jgi:hypothetical protein
VRDLLRSKTPAQQRPKSTPKAAIVKELNSKRFRVSAVLVESNPQIGTIGDLFNCG